VLFVEGGVQVKGMNIPEKGNTVLRWVALGFSLEGWGENGKAIQ
jgi:hypothetical protein